VKIEILLPEWLSVWMTALPPRLEDDVTAMTFALEACRRNLDACTGGPFGAVVVDRATRSILGVGVNLVVQGRASILHAEIVALTLAQRQVGRDSLAADGRSATLYTSAEPCAMCLGAIPWSGVNRVVCGARDADVRAIGFDEGDKPDDWPAKFHRRGIEVARDVLRAEAVQLLARYRTEGGVRYGHHS
jgi:tRNA(Arg) A34 adenosine deaminase TadA